MEEYKFMRKVDYAGAAMIEREEVIMITPHLA